jgi:uridine kinase
MLRYFILALTLLITPLTAREPLIIGISGGTGCGKTTLAQRIFELFPNDAAMICQDSYYKELTHLSVDERAHTNFDHPDSLDFDLLHKHLQTLKAGKSIEVPIYNYCTHSREQQSESIHPQSIIIVEGILLFAVPEIRDLFDMKIFLDTDDDIRLLRRIERDMRERGRDFKSIRDQYIKTVKPMHDTFVEPSKRFADVIIPSERRNETGLKMIASKLKEELSVSN